MRKAIKLQVSAGNTANTTNLHNKITYFSK